MTRVLVVDSLASFLAASSVPVDLSVVTFHETSGIPPMACAGLVPVVTTRVTAADMDQLAGLRVIANYGVGYDNIDVPAARERGILVSNTPGVLTDATAELTCALILATARRIGEGERLVRAGQWRGWQPTQLRGLGLKGRKLGIVGAGRIGREVGLRARAFGMRIVYWSRTRHREWELDCNAVFQELDAVVSTADVLTLH
ncbi:MAG TPA: NAD(P)-dependent oxidoreductase, partial [Longimicrobiales bacterium]